MPDERRIEKWSLPTSWFVEDSPSIAHFRGELAVSQGGFTQGVEKLEAFLRSQLGFALGLRICVTGYTELTYYPYPFG